jgi:NAD(P)-dependent dehydrogenase (short-subunit alcohol dehydrogenase family)
VQMTHAFLPDLIARPSAHLVNIASAAGLGGLPFAATPPDQRSLARADGGRAVQRPRRREQHGPLDWPRPSCSGLSC